MGYANVGITPLSVGQALNKQSVLFPHAHFDHDGAGVEVILSKVR